LRLRRDYGRGGIFLPGKSKFIENTPQHKKNLS
jgi:hypothetical protein